MQLNTSVFEEFPLLTTSRLLLREIQLQDAKQIFAMRANGRVNQFIARTAMQEPQEAESLVERVKNAFEQQQGIGWAGILRDSNEIIGTCGFNSIDYYNLRAEIGGELSVNYWGKNIALEAVGAIVQFGFETLGLHSIEAKVAPDNRGAIYLLEQIGFVKEAHFKDRIYFGETFHDLAIYSMLRP